VLSAGGSRAKATVHAGMAIGVTIVVGVGESIWLVMRAARKFPLTAFAAISLLSTVGSSFAQAPNPDPALPGMSARLGTRTLLLNNTTFSISPTGNDLNNGLSSGTAWATCAHAISVLKNQYDFGGFVATIQFANGTYTDNPCIFDGPFVGTGNSGTTAPIVIQGDVTQTTLGNPPNHVIMQSASKPCVQVQNGAWVQVQFMWLRCVIDGEAIFGGRLFVNNIIDDNCYSSVSCPANNTMHYLAQQHGYIQVDGNNYITGTPSSAIPDAIYEAKHHGNIRLHGVNGGTMYLNTAVTVTVATAYAEDNGDITVTGDLQSVGFNQNGFNISGRCFQINAGSTLQWAGGTATCSINGSPTLQFPGLSPGTAFQGGQVLTPTANTGLLTPVLQFGGLSTGITYSTNSGKFNQTSGQVCFSTQVTLTNKGSATGTATITGLPLVAVSTATSVFEAMPQNMTYTGTIKASVTNNVINLWADNGGVLTALNNAAFANNSSVYVSGCYFVF
jgi:hypothetical protein